MEGATEPGRWSLHSQSLQLTCWLRYLLDLLIWWDGVYEFEKKNIKEYTDMTYNLFYPKCDIWLLDACFSGWFGGYAFAFEKEDG